MTVNEGDDGQGRVMTVNEIYDGRVMRGYDGRVHQGVHAVQVPNGPTRRGMTGDDG